MTHSNPCPRPGCPDRVPVPAEYPGGYVDDLAAGFRAGRRSVACCSRPGCTSLACLNLAHGLCNLVAESGGHGVMLELLPGGRLRLHPEPAGAG